MHLADVLPIYTLPTSPGLDNQIAGFRRLVRLRRRCRRAMVSHPDFLDYLRALPERDDYPTLRFRGLVSRSKYLKSLRKQLSAAEHPILRFRLSRQTLRHEPLSKPKLRLLSQLGDVAIAAFLKLHVRLEVEYELLDDLSCTDAYLTDVYRRFLDLRSQLALANIALIALLGNRLLRGNQAKASFENILTDSDLFQAGFMGLMAAVDRFDPHRGILFSTYAAHHIRRPLHKALLAAPIVPRSPRVVEQHRRLRAAHHALVRSGYPTPSSEEVASRASLAPEQADRVRALYPVRQLSFEALLERDRHAEGIPFRQTARDLHCLEAETPDPHDEAEIQDLHSLVLHEVEQLPQRQRTIIERRFGFHGEPESLHAIGRTLGGLSRERIRQIEAKALTRLSHVIRRAS